MHGLMVVMAVLVVVYVRVEMMGYVHTTAHTQYSHTYLDVGRPKIVLHRRLRNQR